MFGEIAKSGDHYRAALKDEKDQPSSYIGLQRPFECPVNFYYDWLSVFMATLAPSTIIEIGVMKEDPLPVFKRRRP